MLSLRSRFSFYCLNCVWLFVPRKRGYAEIRGTIERSENKAAGLCVEFFPHLRSSMAHNRSIISSRIENRNWNITKHNSQTLFSISPVFSAFVPDNPVSRYIFVWHFHSAICCAFHRWSLRVGRRWSPSTTRQLFNIFILMLSSPLARSRARRHSFFPRLFAFLLSMRSRGTQLNVKISRSELRWIYGCGRGHRCYRHRCCYVC